MGLVDTNVIVIANGIGEASPACVDACVDCLARFTGDQEPLFLDSGSEILEEYSRYVRYGTPQGVGDAFYIWAVTHQATPPYCREVHITPEPEWGFVEFPHDQALKGFDRSDRKFVAVALASGENPTIFNATDSDWRNYAKALDAYVNVGELCR
jgi:hypothetical protein